MQHAELAAAAGGEAPSQLPEAQLSVVCQGLSRPNRCAHFEHTLQADLRMLETMQERCNRLYATAGRLWLLPALCETVRAYRQTDTVHGSVAGLCWAQSSVHAAVTAAAAAVGLVSDITLLLRPSHNKQASL